MGERTASLEKLQQIQIDGLKADLVNERARHDAVATQLKHAKMDLQLAREAQQQAELERDAIMAHIGPLSPGAYELHDNIETAAWVADAMKTIRARNERLEQALREVHRIGPGYRFDETANLVPCEACSTMHDEASAALADERQRREQAERERDEAREKVRKLELVDENIDSIMDRWDQTDPELQRQIVAKLVAMQSMDRMENTTIRARNERLEDALRSPNMIADVEEFHSKFGVKVLDRPGFDAHTTACLRQSLVKEETQELMDAIESRNIEATADAIADSIYVLIGTALSFGIPLAAVWREVHSANMRKVGGARRNDGKILKPEGWTPPDIRAALATQTIPPAAQNGPHDEFCNVHTKAGVCTCELNGEQEGGE
jgi:predicted HAD superfamily Cof-like phosphohydrolase